MISADTSYSLDVQWPLSQLAAMTMTPAAGAAAADGDDHGSDHACTSPTWSPAALRETVDDTTEWITYAEYERRRQSAQGISTSEIASGAPGDDRGGDSTDGCGIGSATEGDVVFASTRSPQAAFELTFDIAEPADGKLPCLCILYPLQHVIALHFSMIHCVLVLPPSSVCRERRRERT